MLIINEYKAEGVTFLTFIVNIFYHCKMPVKTN